MPAKRKLILSDAELLLLVEQGRSVNAIAAEHDVTEQAVSWRLKQARLNLPAPAARRAEEVVHNTLSVWETLNRNLQIVEELRDACVRELRGADGRSIDVGLRAADLDVTLRRNGVTVKVALASLLAEAGVEERQLVSVQSNAADPRQLLLSAIRLLSAQIETGARLAERLYSHQQTQEFMTEVLAVIGEQEPEARAKIVGALQQRRALRSALTPARSE